LTLVFTKSARSKNLGGGNRGKPWSLRFVGISEAYWKPKYEAEPGEKVILRGLAENKILEKALAEMENK